MGAVQLNDGRVLVTGGSSSAVALNTCRLYQPSTRAWSVAPAMITARWTHLIFLLPDGRVLVAGGQTIVNVHTPTPLCEVFNPLTNAWTSVPSMTKARTGHAGALLLDGRVLVCGGYDQTTSLASTEIFDPLTDTWSGSGALTEDRGNHTVTRIPSGELIAIGGAKGIINGSTTGLATCERYSPTSGSWMPIPSMSIDRISHSASLLKDGRILVAGGQQYSAGATAVRSCELYNSALSWRAGPDLRHERVGHAAMMLSNGRVIACGGSDNNSWTSSCESFEMSPRGIGANYFCGIASGGPSILILLLFLSRRLLFSH
jgi:hypothetical protein